MGWADGLEPAVAVGVVGVRRQGAQAEGDEGERVGEQVGEGVRRVAPGEEHAQREVRRREGARGETACACAMARASPSEMCRLISPATSLHAVARSALQRTPSPASSSSLK